jgi:hypothetical protein
MLMARRYFTRSNAGAPANDIGKTKEHHVTVTHCSRLTGWPRSDHARYPWQSRFWLGEASDPADVSAVLHEVIDDGERALVETDRTTTYFNS